MTPDRSDSDEELDPPLHGLPDATTVPGPVTNIGVLAHHIGSVVHQEIRRRDVLDATELPRDALLLAPYVEVDDWSEGRTAGTAFLAPGGTSGVLLVIARRGCGSSTFVRRLCADHASTATAILDLEPDWDAPSVSRLPLEPQRVYILELKNPGTDLPGSGFLDRLAAFGEQLLAGGSRLIVTFTEQLWESVDGWQHPQVPVVHLRAAPDPQRLVEEHLRSRKHPAAIAYVRTATARALLRGMNAVEATRAVETVIRQWGSAPTGSEQQAVLSWLPPLAGRRRSSAPPPEQGFDQELAARIESALGDWRIELDRLFNEAATGPGSSSLSLRLRCLLVSLVVHRTAPAHTIDQDALALETALVRASPGGSHGEPTVATLFSGQGLRSRLAALSAQVDPYDQVVFDRSGYTEAVLVYVWDNFPQIRSVLLDWLVRLPVRNRTAANPAARALAELILRHKDIDRLDESRRIAVEAGRTALLAEVTGRVLADEHMRRGVWQLMTAWAKSQNGPGQAVIDICRPVLLAPGSRPGDRRLAMTRLRHLAQHAENGLRGRLLALLDDLAAEERTLPLLVGEVDTWLTRDRPGHLGTLSLLALLKVRQEGESGPWLLSTPAPLPERLLTRGLAELLGNFRDHPEAVPRAAGWLHPVPEGEGLDQVLDCLAAALSASAEADPSMHLMSALTEADSDPGRLRNLLFQRMLAGTPQGGHPEWGGRPAVQPAEDQPVYGP
ncbi:hypothetical protein HUT16_13905 [Kitasatospora sp. NA04385]|uniref:hypothetical protein n=1 Tax=Kitasatospora sp. NA04385 TaxID=2742135 RepID=UPI00159092D3|nr:hypothetical protein [Kitasatospora sp. NA04385]QKW20016.1 hypothetical protein HUT16_13905 [Kitasatospora sp. NA04385]